MDLIPHDSFSKLLRRLRGYPEHAVPALKGLWETMNTGGFSHSVMTDLMRFNGGLFKNADALPLSNVQLPLPIDAERRTYRTRHRPQGHRGQGVPWPKSLPEQIARQFQRGREGTVQPLWESLRALGQAHIIEGAALPC